MRAKTYDGDFEYIEETPTYQKCANCGHYHHPDRVVFEPLSFQQLCESCLPVILKEMKDYETENPR
jgi:uncharacterized OB-fold protein